jgi:alpha-glucosidase
MLKKLILMTFCLNLILWLGCDLLKEKDECSVSSPDGKINIEVIMQNGKPYYKVLYEKELVINFSKLGFLFKNAESMNKNFEIFETSYNSVEENWKPVYGPSSVVKNHFNELQIKLKEDTLLNREMYLILRAYNDGVGFRYILPEQSNLKEFEITSEETQFNFSGDHMVWWIPADYDSYEHLYSKNLLSDIKAVNTPVTMETKSGLYLSIHEADLTDYAGMTLKSVIGESLTLECDLVPWPDGVKIRASTPHRTPWRTIQITAKPGDLIESHLIENLNEPCQLEDVSWIKPMKYVGIWWGMHIGTESWKQGPYHGATTKNAKRYIDFAAKHKIPGLLIEGWNTGWESWGKEDAFNFTTPYDDFDLIEVAGYAKEKGINLIGHHETGGQVGNYEKNLTAAFELCKKMGIHAVKTGYAGKIRPEGQHHHGQWMVNHYRKVVIEAAEYEIMIDVHEPIKPTGIRRTFPNMITREGMQGMEFNAWSDGNPPDHTTIIPFTRMLAGPLDYTPGIFDIKLSRYKNFRKKIKLRDNLNRRVHTTLAKQLALYVILYSPMQMAADFPENYENQTAFKFIQDVHVTWDETKVLEAKIGDFVIIARRNNEDWFVGAITDENSRDLKLPLSFLKPDTKYVAQIYSDGVNADLEKKPTEIEISNSLVDYREILPIVLAKGGGMAIHLSPATNDDVKKIIK